MQKKYFFNDFTVYKFCKLNELNYSSITYSFRYYIKKSEETIDLIIEKVINNYIKRKERNKVIYFIRELEITGKYNFNLISRFLNLDYFSMYRLHKYGFSKRDAFYIVWFLSDKTNKKGFRTISLKRRKDFIAIYHSKKISKDTPFMFLITLYKMGIKNSTDYLIEKRNDTLTGIIRKGMKRKEIPLDRYFHDFSQEVLKNEFMLYSKITLNIDLQIFKYLNIYAKYMVYKLANIIKREQNILHLDDYNANGKPYIDFIDNSYL